MSSVSRKHSGLAGLLTHSHFPHLVAWFFIHACPTYSILEQIAVGHVPPEVRQHSAQMDLLGVPLARERTSGRGSMRCSGDLSMAAHAELLATQVKDEAALGPVGEESLNSTFGDGSNQWRSSNTSSSSQTHAAIQRMTRLDTAAWQIAYNELKFSRQIGEGSFGRVFLGKWRETTVAIKLLNPTVRKPSHGSDSDDGELGSHQINSCKPGLLDDLDKEAGIMAALRHPNVVMFLGVCLEPPCMVAEVTILPIAALCILAAQQSMLDNPPICMPVGLTAWLLVCLSAYLSVCLSVYLLTQAIAHLYQRHVALAGRFVQLQFCSPSLTWCASFPLHGATHRCTLQCYLHGVATRRQPEECYTVLTQPYMYSPGHQALPETDCVLCCNALIKAPCMMSLPANLRPLVCCAAVLCQRLTA